MKKLTILFLALVASSALWAATFTVDGITYRTLGGDSVAVTSNNYNYSGDITIPSTVSYNSSTYRVTSIAAFAFSGCYDLTSITIPSGVTSIEKYAFYDCSSLISVTIPNSVTSIGMAAFNFCISLSSIDLPNSVTSIESRTFCSCVSLTSITIPSSVTSIGDDAFAYCNSFNPLTIPNTVDSIGKGAFTDIFNVVYSGSATYASDDPYWGAKCINGYIEGYLIYQDATKTTLCSCSSSATGNITIPSSVISIIKGAFADCPSLTSINVDAANTHFASVDGVLFNYAKDTLIRYPKGNTRTAYTIPNTVKSIEEKAFSDCSYLTSITISNSVTCIGNSAFAYCFYLTSITIGKSVVSIGDEAFYDCSSLSSINVDAANTHFASVDGVLFNYAKDTLILYPQGNTRTAYTIPNTVKSIEEEAFAFCSSLTSITIPNSVTSIGQHAFFDCTSLSSITCYATTPPACGSYCFDLVDKSIPLYVPESSIVTYQVANEWQNFTNIQAIVTAIPQITDPQSQIKNKFIKNGCLLIQRDGHSYDVTGVKIK